METIGTLAGGVAHDINNILGIIIGNTELCMDDIPEWNPAYSSLREIVKAVLRAKEVIRQLLTFSRNMEIKRESIDERNYVKKAVNWALRNIGKRNLLLNKKAINVAKEIKNIDSKSAKWIANDAIRELTSSKIQEKINKKIK